MFVHVVRVCVRMCVCMYACACACVCVCVHMFKPQNYLIQNGHFIFNLFLPADGSTDTSKGTNAFTESSNFSFISGGTEVEESEKTTETDGLSQGTNSRPVAIDTETHELEESSGEGGFSFLNAPCPRDEPTLSKEAPPPPKVNQTLPTAHVRTLPASEPPLPPDVVQQPRISPASVVGGGAKKPQRKKKMKAARPGMDAESSVL